MYEIKYIEGLFWIVKDGKRLEDVGGFIDPITPEIILEEIENGEELSSECADR